MRSLRLLLGFFALLLVITAARPLRAFDDWLPITPEDKKISAASENGADAVILYHEEMSDDNTGHRHVYMRIKVLTEKGKEHSDVVIPYDAAYVGITDIKGRTVAPDGTITPFTGKAFNRTMVKGHGIKYLAKSFTLPNVQVGSILEWKYTEYWEKYVFAPHWTLQEDLPQKHAKFVFVPLLKNGYEVQDERGQILDRVYYSFIGMPNPPSIKTIADSRMELEMKDIPAFQEEQFAPPESVLKWRVDFYYGTSKMSKPQEFWKQEGKYWNKDVERFIGHADTSVLKEIVSASDSPEQKLRKIYAFAQKIKNLNYEQQDDALVEMMQSGNKEKRSVDTVLRERKGHRDEITRTFIGLARAAGLEVYAMRVADRDQVFFQPNIPNPGQLTSELAIAVVNGKDVFLDPGTPYCPYGLLPWRHTSSQGLRQMAGGGTELAPTPQASYKDAVSKRVARIALSPDGSAHGQVAIGWAGIEALQLRLSGFRTDEAGRKKQLEDELQSMLPPGAKVEQLQAVGWDTPDVQLSATFKVEIPSFASSTGRRLLVPSNLFQGDQTQPFAHGDRKQPVYFNYPYYAMDDVQITVPVGMRVENLPQDQPLRTDYSLYKVQRSSNENTFSVTRDFAMAGIAFPPKDYPELKKFFTSVVNDDSEQVVLTRAQ